LNTAPGALASAALVALRGEGEGAFVFFGSEHGVGGIDDTSFVNRDEGIIGEFHSEGGAAGLSQVSE